MIRTIRSSVTAAVALTLMLAVSFSSTGCSDSCNPATAEIESLKPIVAGIKVGYEDGTVIELTPDSAHFDEVCDEALRIALSINSQCRCVVDLQTVEHLSETNQAFVYVFFSQPIEITTCLFVDDDDRYHIPTNDTGYRIITPTEVVILPQGTLPEIRAGCETWETETKCSIWGSARPMDTINNLIDDLR